LPNLDALRGQQPMTPTPHAQIRSNLTCTDCNVAGNDGGYSSSGDARYATARTRPENETGQQGGDLGSGNLNWSLPILNLPGRAGLDLSLTLSYNSLAWTKQDNGIKLNADRGFPGPGFHIGFPTLQPRYLNEDNAIYAYLMVLPSGGRVEMRQVGTSNTYESSDSTYTQMKYYAEGAGYAYVYLSDGTRLLFQPSVDNEMRCTQVEDRNGNFITVSYDGADHIYRAYDTLYRTINFNYDADNNLLSITRLWGGTTHTWAQFYDGSLHMTPSFIPSTLVVTGPNNADQTVLNRVVIEDQSYYDFSYTNYGQVWKITRSAPDSTLLAYTTYNLPGSSVPGSPTGARPDCPHFSEQRVWAHDWNNGAEALTTYAETRDATTNALISNGMTLPDRTTKIKESYSQAANWLKGLTTGTEYYSGSTKMKWTTTIWTQDDESLNYQKNPRVKEINIHDAQNNLRRTVITYNPQFGLPSDVDEYDSTGQTVLRRTHTDYEFDSAYIDRRVIGLPTYKYVYQGTSTLQSKTRYFYDWWASDYEDTPQSATQHDPAYGLSLIRGRGNLMMEQRFDIAPPGNAQNPVIEHKWGYNTCGSLTFDRDALGHQTSISYADSFTDSGNVNSFAYPTKVTDADGYQSFASYRYDFGAVARVQGPPPLNQVEGLTQEMTYDPFRRITRVSTKVSNAEYYYKRWVYYNDAMTEVEYSSVNGLTDDTYSYAGRDGAGNVRATAQYHPNSTGGYSAQYIYRDAMNRVVQQTNPTEINAYFQPAGDDGGWQSTTQQYDWKGRPTVTTLPGVGSATIENSYGGCGCAGGEVVTTKDERGRQRRLSMDVFGRLKQVKELNFTNRTTNATTYATTKYDYNVRDQLRTITQLGATTDQNRVRSFDYDGYGRLSKRTTPEQGQVEYHYNTDDTVQWFKDARGAKSVFEYNNRHLLHSMVVFHNLCCEALT
jgi:YD repeat-containing protein